MPCYNMRDVEEKSAGSLQHLHSAMMTRLSVNASLDVELKTNFGALKGKFNANDTSKIALSRN